MQLEPPLRFPPPPPTPLGPDTTHKKYVTQRTHKSPDKLGHPSDIMIEYVANQGLVSLPQPVNKIQTRVRLRASSAVLEGFDSFPCITGGVRALGVRDDHASAAAGAQPDPGAPAASSHKPAIKDDNAGASTSEAAGAQPDHGALAASSCKPAIKDDNAVAAISHTARDQPGHGGKADHGAPAASSHEPAVQDDNAAGHCF